MEESLEELDNREYSGSYQEEFNDYIQNDMSNSMKDYDYASYASSYQNIAFNNAHFEREHDHDNEPPYSRIFIVCGKSFTSDDQLKEYFISCGRIEYCRIIRDKLTNESKGVAYIKFDKVSAAAIAIETMNGKQIAEGSAPLKVMIADAKGSRYPKQASKEPEDTPPRSRLFVICSKDLTEEDLYHKFQVFGELEYCKIMRDKNSGESKGCGYVKFSKASTAATAMENVNEQNDLTNGVKLKVLIADPKNKGKRNEFVRPDYFIQPMFGPRPPLGFIPPYGPYADFNGVSYLPYAPPPYVVPRQRLFVVCHKTATEQQLNRLFSHYPGMEYCDLKRDKNTGESKGFAYVNYSTPQSAIMAKEQLDGYEYPPSFHLKVMFAEPKNMEKGPADPVSNLSDSFAQLMPPSFSSNYNNENSTNHDTHDRNTPEGSRLFIVLMGKVISEYALHDIFAQFPGLEYVKLQKDKNYGYVKFLTAYAAQHALNYLNGAEINGTKLKIQIANPPTVSGDPRRRQRSFET